MTSDDRPILLLLSAPGLRSALLARLGMAGAVVITGTVTDRAIERDAEEAALIVIDEAMLSNAVAHGNAPERLLRGRTIIVAADPENPALARIEGATIVPAHQAIETVLAAVGHLAD